MLVHNSTEIPLLYFILPFPSCHMSSFCCCFAAFLSFLRIYVIIWVFCLRGGWGGSLFVCSVSSLIWIILFNTVHNDGKCSQMSHVVASLITILVSHEKDLCSVELRMIAAFIYASSSNDFQQWSEESSCMNPFHHGWKQRDKDTGPTTDNSMVFREYATTINVIFP